MYSTAGLLAVTQATAQKEGVTLRYTSFLRVGDLIAVEI